MTHSVPTSRDDVSMGQYQQWLHHQEIDRQLRSRLELLEAELAQLQAQILPSEKVAPLSSDNAIIQALFSYQMAESIAAGATATSVNTTETEPAATHAIPVEPSSAPVSQALLAWSRLPNLDSQKMRIPFLRTNRSEATPTAEEAGLLPQDMTTFFNQHPYPVPRPRLPEWLDQEISAPNVPDQLPNNPVDQQTLRTNRLVERWLERWRKTPPESQE